jgi:hypothetical protein
MYKENRLLRGHILSVHTVDKGSGKDKNCTYFFISYVTCLPLAYLKFSSNSFVPAQVGRLLMQRDLKDRYLFESYLWKEYNCRSLGRVDADIYIFLSVSASTRTSRRRVIMWVFSTTPETPSCCLQFKRVLHV